MGQFQALCRSLSALSSQQQLNSFSVQTRGALHNLAETKHVGRVAHTRIVHPPIFLFKATTETELRSTIDGCETAVFGG